MNVRASAIQQKADHVEDLMHRRLRIKGKGLAGTLRRAGRILPPEVRVAAERLCRASEMAGHPKLLIQIDALRLDADYRRCVTYLEQQQPGARQKELGRMMLRSAGTSLLFAVTIMAVLILWVAQK
jgi:hypothetical protein